MINEIVWLKGQKSFWAQLLMKLFQKDDESRLRKLIAKALRKKFPYRFYVRIWYKDLGNNAACSKKDSEIEAKLKELSPNELRWRPCSHDDNMDDVMLANETRELDHYFQDFGGRARRQWAEDHKGLYSVYLVCTRS